MGVISPVYTLYVFISALAKSMLGSCWDEEGGNPGREKCTKLKPPRTACRPAACFFALVPLLICRCIVHFPLSILFSECIFSLLCYQRILGTLFFTGFMPNDFITKRRAIERKDHPIYGIVYPWPPHLTTHIAPQLQFLTSIPWREFIFTWPH